MRDYRLFDDFRLIEVLYLCEYKRNPSIWEWLGIFTDENGSYWDIIRNVSTGEIRYINLEEV